MARPDFQVRTLILIPVFEEVQVFVDFLLRLGYNPWKSTAVRSVSFTVRNCIKHLLKTQPRVQILPKAWSNSLSSSLWRAFSKTMDFPSHLNFQTTSEILKLKANVCLTHFSEISANICSLARNPQHHDIYTLWEDEHLSTTTSIHGGRRCLSSRHAVVMWHISDCRTSLASLSCHVLNPIQHHDIYTCGGRSVSGMSINIFICDSVLTPPRSSLLGRATAARLTRVKSFFG